MVDTNPMDPTSYSAQPARCAKCGALPTDACAKTDAWCEDSSRRFALRDSPWVRVAEGGEAVTQPPAAPLSAEEIKELRPTASEVAFGRQFAIGSGTLARLLDALEALTAENARLKERLGEVLRKDRLKAETLAADLKQSLQADDDLRRRMFARDAETALHGVADWSGDEYDDVTSRTLRNLASPEFMAAAFGEQDGAKEATE